MPRTDWAEAASITIRQASQFDWWCWHPYAGRDDNANVGFFLQTYAHVLKNDDRDAAEQTASFLIAPGWDLEDLEADDEHG